MDKTEHNTTPVSWLPGLEAQPKFDASASKIIATFYVPAFARYISYDRGVGRVTWDCIRMGAGGSAGLDAENKAGVGKEMVLLRHPSRNTGLSEAGVEFLNRYPVGAFERGKNAMLPQARVEDLLVKYARRGVTMPQLDSGTYSANVMALSVENRLLDCRRRAGTLPPLWGTTFGR